MQLSAHQKRYLRGIAHSLDPVVMVGQKGLTPAVLKELDGALAYHELVKVKLADADREDRAETIEALAEASSAELVQTIGRIACFYRRNPKQPKIELPRKAAASNKSMPKKPARK
ncbi:MAG TPA: ribosome assembly RNA-binding protein YhbY [Sphingomicrobium sp.]|nr:ribosome assembly RNA-binding protein YhbY [Sphingomicrobium sp.]